MSTTTFTVTRDDVIQAALRGLSVLEEGATPTAAAVTNAAQALNLIIKNWQKDGIKLWTIDDLQVPLVASQTTYTIGPAGGGYSVAADRPLKLIQAFIRNISVTPNVDIPVQIISRQEYNLLGSKSSTGTTNSVYYTPKTTYGTLSVFLTPDTSAATNYVLYLTVQRPLYDVNVSTDNLDFPSEWFLGLKWGLMAELASEYDKDIQLRGYFDTKAAIYKKELEDWDVDYASTLFTPDTRMYSGGFR